MKNKYVFVAVMLTVILVVSFGFTNIYVSQSQTIEDEDVVVVTSFFPMYIAAMNVIGDTEGVTLKNLSEPQTGCLHDFQLTPADMKLLSTADVFIINGGGIESFMEEIAAQYPELVVVEACEGLELLCGEHEHQHEDEDEHAEDGIHMDEDVHDHVHDMNAHAWMSIPAYRMQIENIAAGLAKADETHAASYLANAGIYDGKLEELAKELEAVQVLTHGKSAISFHCAYDYVAEDLEVSIPFCMDLDEERQVSAGEVAEVIETIEHEQVAYIFAEELYAASMCEMIQKEIDVTVVFLDPLTRGAYDADSYLEGMRNNLKLIKEAFSQ